jgi:uncharacterized membrane protein YdjX (TVP38/TMEM64 family)
VSHKLRIGAALLALAALAVAVRWVFREQLDPKAALAALRSVQDRWWAPVLYVAVYVPGTAVFLPSTVFNLISGAAWGFWRALAINVFASNLAATLQFFFARLLGRETVAKILAKGRLKAFDETAVRHGFRAVVTIRQLPFPHMAVNVAAGVSGMRWLPFALGSLVGALPTIVIYTYFASSLVEGVAGAERAALIRALGCGAIMIFLSVVVPRIVRKLRGVAPLP